MLHGGWLALLLSWIPLRQTGRAVKGWEEEEGSIAVGVEGGYIPVQAKPDAIWEASDAVSVTISKCHDTIIPRYDVYCDIYLIKTNKIVEL